MYILLINLLACALAFLIGAIPFGFIVSKFYKVDIKSAGSGNTGATNVARVLGKQAGIITLLLDIAKGPVAIIAASQVCTLPGFESLFGLLAVVGHCFSPFMKFKGGKGVATSLAVIFSFDFKLGLVAVVVFAIGFMITRIVSLSSLISAAVVSALSVLFIGSPNDVVYAIWIITFIIFLRHKDNMVRLYNKSENKFSFGK